MSDWRVGYGTDLHRLTPGRPLLIGGLAIESPVGSDAHSDGDVLLHALVDALLGALALGDIGDHFPPSDPQWAGADSSCFVAHALKLISKAGYRVGNVDATVHLEAPKLYPHKQTIRELLACLLEIPVEQVSFKAKTGEGLAPIGTGDAIAASVTVLARKG
ncbi:MAG: 2-C-methyl-D-erythritol 2,4-cyclodiphosphate synthase [Candidatus Melainabacteria bacterium]